MKKLPKILPNPFFAKIDPQLLLAIKVAQNWGYFVNFEKLPIVNNRPLGENSPNLFGNF
jgi:hypothetical protein